MYLRHTTVKKGGNVHTYRDALQVHLKNRLGQLFALDYDLMLYDVTSTYFEGQAKSNAMAKRGYSRDHRPDCKQVCIALVVTREGMPVGYEVFDGNRVDVTTVEEIVDKMEGRYGKAERVWVMDRGMSSASNIHWLQRTERRYLIGASKQELKKFERELIDARDWVTVRDDVQAKLCSGPDGTETFVIVRSAERRERERAMHERFSARIIEGLQSLQRRLEKSKKPVERGPLERQIGRLLGKNSRAAGKFAVHVVEGTSKPAPNFVCSGRNVLNGMSGRSTARAVTCFAPTCTSGHRMIFGGPTFS